MTKAKCVFCGVEQEDFKGVYFMKNDGSVNYYSNSKCWKSHLNLKRDKRKKKWTESYYVTRDVRFKRRAELADKLKKMRDSKLARKASKKVVKKEVKIDKK